MQKVLDFLERHVQWVAIAIAAAFLLYALSSYLPVVATPIQTELVAGKPLGPNAVDPEINDVANGLQGRIEGPAKISLPVPNYVERFKAELAKTQKSTPLPRALISSRSVDYPPNLPWDSSSGVTDTSNNKVNVLPVLPPVILEPAPTTDFAQVTVAPAGSAPASPAAPAAPSLPVATGSAAPAAVDTTWVRVPFSVPAGNIAKAFSSANLPANLMTTSFLRVELIRQKQLPGGNWAPEELVDILPTIAMPALPPEGPQSLSAQQQYLVWATGNQVPIVQPDFFPIVAGSDPRMTKGEPTAGVAVAPKAFDPETFPPAGAPGGDLGSLTEEQKAAVLKARQKKAAAEAKEKQGHTTGGGGGGGSGRSGRGGAGGGGAGAVPHSLRPGPLPTPPEAVTPLGTLTPFQARGVPGGDPSVIGGNVDGPSYPGMQGGITGAPSAAPISASQIPVVPLPSAPFDPAQVAGGIIQGWAYDVTAAADSTYRYRVRYKLKNPIFGVQNVANNAAVIAQFALVGEDANGWTDPITIAPLTHVYLAQLPTSGATRIGFTVFRWQAGKRNRTTVLVGPGDSIGKVDGGIDYRTHWTFVDIRRDSSAGAAYALLMNADGVMRKVDFDADKATPLFKQLTEEVDGPQTAPPATAGPGGAPVPPGAGTPGAEGGAR